MRRRRPLDVAVGIGRRGDDVEMAQEQKRLAAGPVAAQTGRDGPPPLNELQELGFHDVLRERWPQERVFTYWDYRAGMFHQDCGMRIDLVLASDDVADRVKAAWVDRQARKGKGPSDHAPVMVDLDEAPDGDIGPVVPPPSAPVTRRGAKKLPQAP